MNRDNDKGKVLLRRTAMVTVAAVFLLFGLKIN